MIDKTINKILDWLGIKTEGYRRIHKLIFYIITIYFLILFCRIILEDKYYMEEELMGTFFKYISSIFLFFIFEKLILVSYHWVINGFKVPDNGMIVKNLENGHREESIYINGKKNGLSKTFDENNNLIFQFNYKNDVLDAFGSPSIKISDVDDVWIYLISIKHENVFEKDEINFQQILRFQFDHNHTLVKFDSFDHNKFTEIAFSDEKTTINRDAYGISDQIYDAFTKGTTQ